MNLYGVLFGVVLACFAMVTYGLGWIRGFNSAQKIWKKHAEDIEALYVNRKGINR